MKLIKDLGKLYANKNSKTKEKYGLYECPSCLIHFRVMYKSVKYGRSTKCRVCADSIIHNTTHKQSSTKLYRAWTAMKQRCYNPNTKRFDRYGGRGISVCDEWRNNFEFFYSWSHSNGYDESLSIDRINNDGNYEPNNCRWTTGSMQSMNTVRLSKKNTSGYRGVDFNKIANKWRARIMIASTQINLGYFDSSLDASKAYDSYVVENNLSHTINGVLFSEIFANI